MTRPQIQQHMRVEVCRFCGCDRSECKEKCVSGTTELPIETLNELRPRKVSAKELCRWPEWKALTDRLGVPPCHTRVVLDVSIEDGVRLTVTTIGRDHACPTPPADTPHTDSSDSSTAEQKHAPRPHSVDTTGTGPS